MLSSFFINTPGEGEYHLTGVVIIPNFLQFSGESQCCFLLTVVAEIIYRGIGNRSRAPYSSAGNAG